MLQLLPGGIADHFLPAAWLRPRHGRANCHLEKAAGPGLGHQFITLPTSPLPLPRPHRLADHKSFCMRPRYPGNVLFPRRTSSASSARPLSREPSAFASPAFSGTPAPSSRELPSELLQAPPASAVWVFIDLSSDPLTGSRTPAP